jgi:hypothetical protein
MSTIVIVKVFLLYNVAYTGYDVRRFYKRMNYRWVPTFLENVYFQKYYSNILLHCVDLALYSFSVYMQLRLFFALLLFTVKVQYVFRPNWPSSGVEV